MYNANWLLVQITCCRCKSTPVNFFIAVISINLYMVLPNHHMESCYLSFFPIKAFGRRRRGRFESVELVIGVERNTFWEIPCIRPRVNIKLLVLGFVRGCSCLLLSKVTSCIPVINHIHNGFPWLSQQLDVVSHTDRSNDFINNYFTPVEQKLVPPEVFLASMVARFRLQLTVIFLLKTLLYLVF